MRAAARPFPAGSSFFPRPRRPAPAPAAPHGGSPGTHPLAAPPCACCRRPRTWRGENRGGEGGKGRGARAALPRQRRGPAKRVRPPGSCHCSFTRKSLGSTIQPTGRRRKQQLTATRRQRRRRCRRHSARASAIPPPGERVPSSAPLSSALSAPRAEPSAPPLPPSPPPLSLPRSPRSPAVGAAQRGPGELGSPAPSPAPPPRRPVSLPG